MKKTKRMMITSNRHLNLVIKNNQGTKHFFLRTTLSQPPRNESWQKTFNVMRLSKSTSIKYSLRMCQLSQLKRKNNASLEESHKGQKLLKCPTTKNSPVSIFLMVQEKLQRPDFKKHKKFMRSAAPSWQKKKRTLIAFSKKFAPMMN